MTVTDSEIDLDSLIDWDSSYPCLFGRLSKNPCNKEAEWLVWLSCDCKRFGLCNGHKEYYVSLVNSILKNGLSSCSICKNFVDKVFFRPI